MQSNWSGSWELVDSLISCGFSPNMRIFRRNQALTLLSALLRNQALQESAPKELKAKLLGSLCKKLVAEFHNYIKDSGTVKPRFLCELLNITRGLHLAGADSYKTEWNHILDVLEKLRAHIPKNRHFQDVKKAYNKVCAPLKIKVVQGCEKR